MSMLLDDFKTSKRDLKRIFGTINDQDTEIEEEADTGNPSLYLICSHQADEARAPENERRQSREDSKVSHQLTLASSQSWSLSGRCST